VSPGVVLMTEPSRANAGPMLVLCSQAFAKFSRIATIKSLVSAGDYLFSAETEAENFTVR